MIYKRCGSCGKKIPVGEVCECSINNARERYKRYSKQRNDKQEQSFYHNSRWINKRSNRTRDLIYVDWFEYYTKGKAVEGYTLHHIIELKDDWSMRLDDDNLIYLTQSNHRLVHEAYLKSEKDKKEMQNVLFYCLKRAKMEFGI